MFNKLIFNSDMSNFLRDTYPNKISMLLIHGAGDLISEEGNYINRDPNEVDVLTYIPKSRYSKIGDKDPFSDDIGRVSIKIGRFVRKFLSKYAIENHGVTDKSIESYVNTYKSYFQRNIENIKIVEGDEIKKWYLEDSYYILNNENRIGSLWASCMRQRERNNFLNLYATNPNIKMLILLTDDGKLSARALLWDNATDIKGKSYKIMDRIYSVYEHDVIFIKDWAKLNGYIPKMDQNSRSERHFIVDNNVKKLELFIKLENYKLDNYPYLDTFKYFDPQRGTLSNSDSFSFEYVLIQTNGGLYPSDPTPQIEDDYLEDDYDEAQEEPTEDLPY